MKEELNLGAIDANLKIEKKLKEENIVFYNVKEQPFDVYGFEPSYKPMKFLRLPAEVGENTNKGVTTLYKMTSGGCVRFTTDSEYVAIRCSLPMVRHMPHMPLLGSSGFDLYFNFPDGTSAFRAALHPPVDMVDGYESVIHFKSRMPRMLQINFPLYNPVDELYIGLEEGASLDHGMKFINEKPVVFYGSSITQGCAASRPGNCYVNILSRRLNLQVRNLGFSGSGKAEQIMCDFLATIDTPLFVMDYDHNAPSAEYLSNTHYNLYATYRRAHPDTPIIMMSRPSFHFDARNDEYARRDVVYNTYRKARADGDKNVHFIDGASWLGGFERNECTVDAIHPNDLGFYRMADYLTEIVHNILIKKELVI